MRKCSLQFENYADCARHALKGDLKSMESQRQVGFRRNDIGSKQDPLREIVSANKKAFYDLAESGRAHKRDGRYLAAKYSTFLP